MKFFCSLAVRTVGLWKWAREYGRKDPKKGTDEVGVSVSGVATGTAVASGAVVATVSTAAKAESL